MGIDLLGPLRFDGVDPALRRRDHVVLAALALRSGEVVTADQLAEALWGDEPPPSWPKVVQGCVLRLRRTFGPPLIETAPGGYRLTVTGDELDIQRFEQSVERGRLLVVAGESDRAAVAFGRALALWRGSPFDVLDPWPPGRIESARLEAMRRDAEEGLIEARLHSGEHRDVVPLAEALVSEEPLREHRWALFALALYRCGRQAEALRALKRARGILVEQLGIEPGAELVALEAAILRQDDALLGPAEPPMIADQCPYKGLAPYGVDDNDTFFGRDDEIVACVERLRTTSLLVITGPSGCGKSSLARAGLVPVLRRAGHVVAVFLPGRDPEAALAEALASVDRTPVLVVDQFEELFAIDDRIGARARLFCERLARYSIEGAPVVVTVRADHVAALAADPEFARLAERGLHLVRPLAGDDLRQAIEGPAALAGLRVEPGLVDLLVRDCEGEPGALPLLSHALAETWQRRDGRVLTVEGYRATGEIRGAVARSADRLYESLPADQRPKLRSVLLRLVSPSADGEPVRSRVPTRTLMGDADRERLLGLLVRARLVTAEQDSVELAHEALARAWPRLRSWLDEDAAGQQILRHLLVAADGWESLGRPASELYRGARLDTVLEWQASTSPDLTDGETAFLDAAVAEADSENRIARERARADRRQRRQRRGALAGAAVLLVATIAGGVVAYGERQANQREQRESALSALQIKAEAVRSDQPDLAALLAVEAYRLAPDAASESALFGVLSSANGVRHIEHTDLDLGPFGSSAGLVPGTDSLVIADARGIVHLVDVATGERRQLEPLSDRVGRTEVAMSTGGQYVAGVWRSTTTPDHGLLTVWDIRTGEQRFRPVDIPFQGRSVAISDDGALAVASGGIDLPTQIHDGETGELRLKIEPAPRRSDAGNLPTTERIAFDPAGRLALVSLSSQIRFFDPTTGQVLARFDAPPRTSGRRVFFDRAGTTMITVGSEGFIAFDMLGSQLSANPHPVPECKVFAYDGPRLALLCGTASGQVIVYDVTTGEEIGRFDAQRGAPCALLISDDGARLFEFSTCDDGATIVERRFDGGGPITRLAFASTEPHLIQTYGFAGDASALVARIGIDDETLAIDPSTGAVLDRFPDAFGLLPTDEPNVVTSTFADGSIASYDIANHTQVGPSVDPGFFSDIVDTRGGRVLVGGHDEEGDARIQGVDLETGRLVGPAIDGSGEFEIPVFHLTTDALYLVAEPVDGGETRLERRDRDTGRLLGEPAPGYRDIAVEAGVVIAVTTDGRILELDALTLEPVGLPFPAVAGPYGRPLLDAAGRRLLVVGGSDPSDMTLRFYDVASRAPIGDQITFGKPVYLTSAMFRADGLEVAADTVDGIVVLDLDPAHWEVAACKLAGRNLTRAEWDEYIGDLAVYRRTCPDYREGE